MTVEERQEYSDEICERVLEMSEWATAKNVVLFSPLPSEPIITPLHGMFDVRYLAGLCNIVRKQKIDLIQTHLFTAAVYGALAGLPASSAARPGGQTARILRRLAVTRAVPGRRLLRSSPCRTRGERL